MSQKCRPIHISHRTITIKRAALGGLRTEGGQKADSGKPGGKTIKESAISIRWLMWLEIQTKLIYSTRYFYLCRFWFFLNPRFCDSSILRNIWPPRVGNHTGPLHLCSPPPKLALHQLFHKVELSLSMPGYCKLIFASKICSLSMYMFDNCALRTYDVNEITTALPNRVTSWASLAVIVTKNCFI